MKHDAQKPRRAQRPRRRRPLWRYAFLAAAALMTVSTAAAVGIFIGFVRTLPPIEQLEHYNPPEVTQVTDRTGTMMIGEFKQERRYVTPISEIPEHLQHAFLAIEDARFYKHFGVDIIGIARAMLINLRSGSLKQGGSTITQQLTRNIMPERVGFERSIERKIREAILALQIERRYSKKQILEFYLNHIEFIYNSFGVTAAASTYFSKSLDELTIAECATLAAMPQNPVVFNPILHPERTIERRNLVLQRMLELKYITPEEYAEAIAEPLVTRRGYGPPSLYPYFLGALQMDLNRRYGISDDNLKQGGYLLTSTVDPRIQDACIAALSKGLVEAERQWQAAKPARHNAELEDWNGVLRPGMVKLMRISDVDGSTVTLRLNNYVATLTLPDELPYYEPEGVIEVGKWLDVRVEAVEGNRVRGSLADREPVQGSIVVLDVRTGEVLCLVGGSNFYSMPGESWNLAIQGGRQPGSVLKPLFYAAAMERGVQPNAIIVDEPVEYGTASRPYRPVNYERNFIGPMTLIEALEHSRNVPTIRLFEGLGVRDMLDIVRRFDFMQDAPSWDMMPELATCLGTLDTKPIEMAAAYQAIANQGVAVRPEFFRTMLDKEGQVALTTQHWEEQVIDPIAAIQTVYMLRQVVLTGTGYGPVGSKLPSPPNPPIAGKTGTTTDNLDAWFAGFTPDIVLVVNVGFNPPRPLGPRLTGSRLAAPIWADAMERILATRDDWAMEFEMPGGVELADVCRRTGKLAGDFCRQNGHAIYRSVPFRPGRVPGAVCDGSIAIPLIAPVGDSYRWAAASSPIRGYARRSTRGSQTSSAASSTAGDSLSSSPPVSDFFYQ